MFLARCMRDYPDALRATLQGEYGLNIDDMGTRFSFAHAAACAANASTHSPLWARLNPRMAIALGDFPIQALLDAIRPPGDGQALDEGSCEMDIAALDGLLEGNDWRDVDGI